MSLQNLLRRGRNHMDSRSRSIVVPNYTASQRNGHDAIDREEIHQMMVDMLAVLDRGETVLENIQDDNQVSRVPPSPSQ